MKDLGPTAVVCRLSVSESKLSDTGSWMCELSNSAGKTSSTCSVKVVGMSIPISLSHTVDSNDQGLRNKCFIFNHEPIEGILTGTFFIAIKT